MNDAEKSVRVVVHLPRAVAYAHASELVETTLGLLAEAGYVR